MAAFQEDIAYSYVLILAFVANYDVTEMLLSAAVFCEHFTKCRVSGSLVGFALAWL